MPASNRFKLTCVLSLAAATTLALPLIAESPADYWPQWRGPNHVGSSSTAKDLPVGWSATENVIWRVRSPSWSAATPIIWGDYVFITSAEEGFNDALKFEPRGRPGGPRGKRGGPGGGFGGPRGRSGSEGNQGGPRAGGPGGGPRGEGRRRGPGGDGPGGPPGGRRGGGFRQNARPESNEHTKLFLMALNRKDGSVMWRKETGDNNQIYRKQNMASPSPVTDGKHVWVMTGRGTLTSFDFGGNQQWRRELQKDYGEFGLNWGYASSPRLHEGRLYIQVLHGMITDESVAGQSPVAQARSLPTGTHASSCVEPRYPTRSSYRGRSAGPHMRLMISPVSTVTTQPTRPYQRKEMGEHPRESAVAVGPPGTEGEHEHPSMEPQKREPTMLAASISEPSYPPKPAKTMAYRPQNAVAIFATVV